MRIKTRLQELIKYRGKFSSRDYWESRYVRAGNSGTGSYGQLAAFKASILNSFIRANNIKSVIEFGSGDGNQVRLANYPHYVGYDVSATAVASCRQVFERDKSKEFFLLGEYDGRIAELALSLDVIFHLTEDAVFDEYMRRLFDAASRYVVIYSSNQDNPIKPISIHVRHRKFSVWVERFASPSWTLVRRIPNAYPYNGNYEATSFSDFYFYEKESEGVR